MPDTVTAPNPATEAAPDAAPVGGGAAGSGEAAGTAVPPTPVPATPPAPIALTAPEGVEVDAAAIATWATEQGLTQAQAEAVLGREVSAKQSAAEALADQVTAAQTEWLEAAKADPEIGGAKFDASAESARRAIAAYGSDALKKALDETGLGNHPELIRVFAKIGAAMREDSFAGAGGSNAAASDPASILYPTSKG